MPIVVDADEQVRGERRVLPVIVRVSGGRPILGTASGQAQRREQPPTWGGCRGGLGGGFGSDPPAHLGH